MATTRTVSLPGTTFPFFASPFQVTVWSPASREAGTASPLRTTRPAASTTVTETRAERASPKVIGMSRPAGGTARSFGTRRNPSVSSTTKLRVIAELCPMSSTAFTSNAHAPAATTAPTAAVPASGAAGNGTGYVPGACCAVVETGVDPSGARSVTVTDEGRTTL